MINGIEISPIQQRVSSRIPSLALYLSLTKPRLSSLVLLTAAVGFLMGSNGISLVLLHVLVGTALAAGGANALNMFIERDIDSLMSRTASRPIPAGLLEPADVLRFGMVAAVGGVAYLAWFVNPLTSLLGALTISSYLFFYTPLKRKTSLSTVAGALPGALPPMMGWAAARNELGTEAWLLFFILFLWQLPHFLAIAWLWREDYARAGCPVLPVEDPTGRSTGRQVVLQSIGLMLVSLAPALFGLAGPLYFFSAFLAGLLFVHRGVLFALGRTTLQARRLFHASLLYLPLLLTFLTIDRLTS